MNRTNHKLRAALLLIVVPLISTAKTRAEAPSQATFAEHLVRAQQQYDDGFYRQAASNLEQLVGETSRERSDPQKLAAIRLLTLVQHHSADLSGAAKSANRFVKLTSESDAEILLILA